MRLRDEFFDRVDARPADQILTHGSHVGDGAPPIVILRLVRRTGRGTTPRISSPKVETDDRGYICIVDRANTGMHILAVTGDAAAVAGLPR